MGYYKSYYNNNYKLRDYANSTYKPNKAPSSTYKQQRACEKIADKKGLYLPSNYKSNWKVASGFISKFGDRSKYKYN